MLSTKHSTGLVRVQSRYKTTLHATYVPTPTCHDTPTATHTNMHTCTHTHASTHKCTHTQLQHTPKHSHTHNYTHTHTYASKHPPTHPHAHTHTHTLAHTHARTHTHTHAHINIYITGIPFVHLFRSDATVVVEDYNQHMFGVDKLDQLVSYCFLHKSVKWRKVFYWCLEVV